MRTTRHLPALLLPLLLLGCPETPQGGGGSGTGGGKGPAPTTEGGGAGGGGAGGTTEAAGAGGGDATTPWTVIPAGETRQKLYPMLQNADVWPAPAGLKPVADVPAEKRPDPAKVQILKDLVQLLVHPDLRPKDMDAAIGVDEQGRTFMRLGKEKAKGTATLDVTPGGELAPGFQPPPVFAMSLDDPSSGKQTIEALRRRVNNVVSPDLGKELKTRELQPKPDAAGDAGVAAMARLDRGGFGGQFPLLYAWGTDKHLLVLLQEVPHHSLDPKAAPTPR